MAKEKGEIRLLRADEIECRIGTMNERGLSLLLFKDARVDQKVLDETFTPMGWKRSHQLINGSLFCTVEVWDESKGQWVGKQDVGTESYSEKEKGAASDSFKRACFNWGIGRELYTAPFIWIPSDVAEIQKKDGKYMTRETFQVIWISYNEDREINALEITNGKRQTVYAMGKKRISQLEDHAIQRELQRTGVALETVLARYGVQSLEQLSPKQYQDAMKGLKRSSSKAVAG